jgi:hypothetical protein
MKTWGNLYRDDYICLSVCPDNWTVEPHFEFRYEYYVVGSHVAADSWNVEGRGVTIGNILIIVMIGVLIKTNHNDEVHSFRKCEFRTPMRKECMWTPCALWAKSQLSIVVCAYDVTPDPIHVVRISTRSANEFHENVAVLLLVWTELWRLRFMDIPETSRKTFLFLD